jgi:hypothetical protein
LYVSVPASTEAVTNPNTTDIRSESFFISGDLIKNDGVDIPTQLTSRCEFSPNKEQNERANDRQDETGWVKLRTWLRSGKQASDQSPDDRATDAEQRSHYESEMLRTRHYGPCDQANDEPDNYGPNDM